MAQTDFTGQYFNAKTLFREGKYNLAMESFKPLITHDANNKYSEYASFYYALSAYHQNFDAVARDMLNQIKKLYPSWEKIDEVNFWIGKIHMDNKNYFEGLKVWNTIRDKEIKKNIQGLKVQLLSTIDDVETLRMMNEEFPDDEVVARSLAKSLSKHIQDAEYREELEAFIDKYKFKREDFIADVPKTYYRDTYVVAAMFPFMVSTLEANLVPKRNQIILDFYEGLKLAVDTLAHQNINISLRAYDTERRPEKIRRLLQTEELKNADLIIGPFFTDENALIQEFSITNQINVFNPFSNNADMVASNDYGFLFQPSYETFGRKSAEFLAERLKRRKTCMVFYGTSRKDSVQAAAFVQKATEAGLNVVSSMAVPKESSAQIISILATPTEFDEWKNPIEFELKKDSIGAIYVASDDPLIYTKVISGVDTRADSIVIVGSENWLNDNAVDFEKYQSLGVVLAAPGFTTPYNMHYKTFLRKYIKVHGRIPNNYAKLGYEMMLFLGNSLKKYGGYFQDGFNREKLMRGYLFEGYNFQFSHDNQLIPFIKFRSGQLQLIKTL